MEKSDEEVINTLKSNNFEIDTLEDVKQNPHDKEIYEYMKSKKVNILLANGCLARFWYFTNLENMCRYFRDGGKVGTHNHAYILA